MTSMKVGCLGVLCFHIYILIVHTSTSHLSMKLPVNHQYSRTCHWLPAW